jgi:hypothetical protein
MVTQILQSPETYLGNNLFTNALKDETTANQVAEHYESFTIDARQNEVRELCTRYLTGFDFRLLDREEKSLTFEKGNKKKNFYTFSFEQAYKQVVLSLVGNERIPVTSVSILFKLPYLRLKKEDIEGIKSITNALREFILISVGYDAIETRGSKPLTGH